MSLNFFKKVQNRLTLLFQVVAIIPFLFFASLTYEHYKQNIQKSAFDKLVAIRESKKEQIESYFYHLHKEIKFLSESATIIDAIKSLTSAFHHDLNDQSLAFSTIKEYVSTYYSEQYYEVIDHYYHQEHHEPHQIPSDPKTILLQYLFFRKEGSQPMQHPYSKAHQKHHNNIERILDDNGYHDVFLVDHQGYVVYSTIKEIDFATNIFHGPHQESALAKVSRKMLRAEAGATTFEDFEFYAPSYYRPSAFIASPIVSQGKNIGVLVFQLPVHDIDYIMTSHTIASETKMDQSGESYLVGNDHKMRSTSRFIQEDSLNFFKTMSLQGHDEKVMNQMALHKSTILFYSINHSGLNRAFKGSSGTSIVTDYRGTEVLSAYTSLDIPDVQWVLLSEIDKTEAMQGLLKFRNWLIVSILTAILSIFIASFYIATDFSRPIKKLVSAMKEVTQGNLGIEVNSNSINEIKILVLTFNQMVARIREIHLSLDQQNQELRVNREELVQRNNSIEHKNVQLQEALEIKNKLLSIVSHDFRSPLASLKGTLTLLEENILSEEEFREFSKVLSLKLKNTSFLLDNLLYWAKSQLKGFELSLDRTSLLTLINENIDLFRVEAEKKGIELICRLKKDVIFHVDGNMIDLVIRNLMSNAIKFCHEDGTISLEVLEENEMATLSIKDTGVGMTEHQVNDIFRNTSKAALGTDNEKGTGLGLALCYEFVKRNNGDIWVQSKKDYGTTFFISLPLWTQN